MDLSKLNEIDLSDIDIEDLKKIGAAPNSVKSNCHFTRLSYCGGSRTVL